VARAASAPQPADAASPGGRPRELLAPVVHRPLARFVARALLRTDIGADAVTLIAFVTTIAAAVLFAVGTVPTTLSAAAVLFVATVLDGTDGALARLTGSSTPRGAWLDTMLDKVGDSAVALVSLGAALARMPRS
jgi:1L-myo-inositol 1-phosphate cytidylyltransferase / CDP-L-myo-inositol myo-inositolphosphotransferase